MSTNDSERDDLSTVPDEGTIGEDKPDDGEKPEGEGDGPEGGEKIPDNPLVQEFIPECLSLLCKIGSGLTHAYVRFDGRERDFTCVEHLKNFVHIRYVDLTGNILKEVTALNELKHLLVLRLDKNNLTTAELEPLPFLQIASFSDNKIQSTEGINHPLLEKLNLNSNQIEIVSGLNADTLSHLTVLELRGNRLTTTEGLVLPSLKSLYLAANRLTELTGLDQLVKLETLHVRDNQIGNLDGFTETMERLTSLNLRGNDVREIVEMKKLQALPALTALSLQDNPCNEEEGYRVEILILLRKLEKLDKDEYTEDERGEAEDIYEQRRLEELSKEEGEGEEEGSDQDLSADE